MKRTLAITLILALLLALVSMPLSAALTTSQSIRSPVAWATR